MNTVRIPRIAVRWLKERVPREDRESDGKTALWGAERERGIGFPGALTLTNKGDDQRKIARPHH
jgi:hypothetical protein